MNAQIGRDRLQTTHTGSSSGQDFLFYEREYTWMRMIKKLRVN
jgi:hypothetical protein